MKLPPRSKNGRFRKLRHGDYVQGQMVWARRGKTLYFTEVFW